MTETAYAVRTNHAFVLTETLRVDELMYQGVTQQDIRQRVLIGGGFISTALPSFS